MTRLIAVSSLDDEAILTALSLIRQAIEHGGAGRPEGDVMDVVNPYLVRVLEPSFSGEQHDATEAFRALLAALARWAGATYAALIEARDGRPPAKAELLARLDELEHAVLTERGKEDS